MTHVVVGSGINGLVSAMLLQRRGAKDIVVVEAEPTLGGLFRSFDYGEYGVFDYGIHVFQNTGVSEIEEVIRSAIHDSEWVELSGMRREIAGLYFSKTLQTNTAFLDLRNLPDDLRIKCSAGVVAALNKPESSWGTDISMMNCARRFYGKPVAELVIKPILESVYRRPAEEISNIARQLTPFQRIVLFDEQPFLDLMKSQIIRERVGFPEQRTLPKEFESGLSSYYPKKFGLQRVIDGMTANMKRAGINILTAAKVVGIESRDSSIFALKVAQIDQISTISNIESLVWTAGLPALNKLLFQNATIPAGGNAPPIVFIVNILLKSLPRSKDLYFFYSYLPGGRIYRVSNPAAYCAGEDRPHKGMHPLCIEVMCQRPYSESNGELVRATLMELIEMGIIDDLEEVAFARAEQPATGFPSPTINNAAIIGNMREGIAELQLNNLLVTGVQSKPELFFYRDVLRDSYAEICRFVGG